MRRLARVPALLLVALGLVLVALPGTAGAVEPEAAGWWSRTSTSPLPVNPAAPTAGENQLVVQGEPSGANAIAALRWTIPEGESSPSLTLKSADGSVVPAEALILACKAGTPWTEAKGAPLAEAPKADCGTSVNGIIADDGTITFALGSLMNGQVLDIVLTPGKTPEDAGSTFSLVFDRPGADALVTTAGGGGSAFTGGSSDFAAPSSSPSGSGSFSAPSTGGSSFSAPSTDAGAATPPAAEAALPPENQVTALETPAQPAASTDDRGKAKTLGIGVLLLGAALAAWAFMSGGGAGAGATALPGALPVADTAPGGLGRFVRPRVGPPPSLS